MKIDPVEKILETTSAFKILADPTRFRIICLLIENNDRLCVNEIAQEIGCSHSAASHQLAKLEAKRVVSRYRDGQMVCYTLTDTELTNNLRRVITIFKPV